MSPNAAVTLLTGADPKNPAKKRVTSNAVAVLLVADPILKSARPIRGVNRLTRRPQISLTGAHTQGPKMKPITYSETVRIVNSVDICSSWLIDASAGAMMDEASDPTIASIPSWKVIHDRSAVDQLNGSSGSLVFHFTRNGSSMGVCPFSSGALEPMSFSSVLRSLGLTSLFEDIEFGREDFMENDDADVAILETKYLY
jgi:hypothetical protein